ncbi:iron ABC transporter permease [Planctellipticum variicoloris]|uniref:iron ABC transporter permease n=1 Tax=Planctellipticum variicoloris TaxID=3064265 RepID=UPI00301322F9|nr:iron ABC transporter permease [Planctomycetaceae bacterium SH412]
MKHWRDRLVLPGAVGLVAAIFAASLLVGPTEIPLETVFRVLRGQGVNSDSHLILRDIRLPRSLLTLMVGASLAVAGAVMQGVTRNPLAGPSIMGLSGGAALASLISLIAWPALSYNGSIVATFVGAAVGYGCVLGVAALTPGGFSPVRIALAGAVVSALFSAVTQGLVIAYGMSSTMLYRTIGGITNVTWDQVVAVAPCCVAGLAGAWWLAPGITILSLGDDVARNLGLRSFQIRVASTVLVLLLTGSAVAVAGPVGFVGLMTPHVCRLAVGADQRRLLPLSLVAGAGLTTLADLIARTILGARGELPLGIVTSMLGAPCFLWLIRSRRHQRLDVEVPRQVPPRECWRPRVVLPLAAGLLCAIFLIALHHGKAEFPLDATARVLVGQGRPEEQLVLWSIRIPRLIFAVLIGVGVAVAGTILQAVLRNDLAEPGILGVSSGASLAIVVLLAVCGHSALGSLFLVPLAGICGALGITGLVYLLCRGGQQSSPKLLLTGVALSSIASSMTLLLSLQLSSEIHAFVVAFGAGSMNAAGWNSIAMLAAILVLLVPLAWSFSPTLNVLRLGDQAAMSLGVALPGWSLGLLSLAVAICASCLAVAGDMIFLGMIAPHIARRLVGTDHAAVIPLAGLVGATLVILADMIGGSILPNSEIPAGVFVSALGAPYFLYLLTRP